MSEYLVQKDSLTAIADEVRTLSGTTEPMSLDAMASNVSDANTEVAAQEELLATIASELQNKVGVSPLVEVSKSGTVTTISITDVEGTKTATINDGKDGFTPVKGVDYNDGVSPTVEVTEGDDLDTGATVHIVSITDAEGEHYFYVHDGATGNGIESITQTITSIEDSGENIVTATMTDGTTSNFSIKNGSKGSTGQRGFSLLKITTAPSSYTTATGGFTPTYRVALNTVLTQSTATEVLVGDTIAYSYYRYQVGYVDASYVYLGERVSVRGSAGKAGTTPVKGTDYYTEAEKTEMVASVKAAMPTFTLVGTDANDVTHTWTLYGVEA